MVRIFLGDIVRGVTFSGSLWGQDKALPSLQLQMWQWTIGSAFGDVSKV
jgi:hypothetical protein